MAYYAYTSTTSLSTTLTRPSLPTDLPAPPPVTIYTTLPFPSSDPQDAKLLPVLAVAEWDVAVVDSNGVLFEHTTTVVRPKETLLGEGGGGVLGGQKGVEIEGKTGWASWTGQERWGVLAATLVAVVLLLGAGSWVVWIKYGNGKAGGGPKEEIREESNSKDRRSNIVRTGETGFLRGVKKMAGGSMRGRDDRKESPLRTEGRGHARREVGTVERRNEMSGGLKDMEPEVLKERGPRPRLYSSQHNEVDTGATSESRIGKGYGTT